MKALILAGGKGTRMRPLSYDTPKSLIKINGKPFLYFLIERLKKAGFDDFGIIYMDRVEQWNSFFDEFDVKAELILQSDPKGSGDAVRCTKDFVKGENFVVVNGDSLFEVEDYAKLRRDDKFCYVAGLKHEHPENYGVLFEEDGVLKKLIEKPKKFVGNLVNVGIYKFTPEIFDALDMIELSPRGEYEVTDAISMLALQGKVKVIRVSKFMDFGKLEDIPKMEEYLKDSKS